MPAPQVTRADLIDPETLPCGCVIGNALDPATGARLFVMIPCDLECVYYRYAIEETKREHKPVYFGEDR